MPKTPVSTGNDLTVGWSKFAADRHVEGSGNSFFTISKEEVIERVKMHWNTRIAGTGETGRDRKVLVAVEPDGFFLSTTPLVDNLPLRAEVTRRQPHEDPHIETYVDADDAKRLGIEYEPALYCRIVCYSKEALLENDGERTTDDDWEIVAVLASKYPEVEPMPPLTMARNFLEKPGGSKSVYTAQEFAEAIYNNSKKSVKIKKGGPATDLKAKLSSLRQRLQAGQAPTREVIATLRELEADA